MTGPWTRVGTPWCLSPGCSVWRLISNQGARWRSKGQGGDVQRSQGATLLAFVSRGEAVSDLPASRLFCEHVTHSEITLKNAVFFSKA